MIENALFSETDSPWNFPEHGIPGAEERIEKLKQKDQQDLTLAENEELDKLNNNHLVLKTFREQFNVVLIDAENRLKSSGTAFDSEDNPSRFFVYIQREMDKFSRLTGNLEKAFSAALNKSRLDKYSFLSTNEPPLIFRASVLYHQRATDLLKEDSLLKFLEYVFDYSYTIPKKYLTKLNREIMGFLLMSNYHTFVDFVEFELSEDEQKEFGKLLLNYEEFESDIFEVNLENPEDIDPEYYLQPLERITRHNSEIHKEFFDEDYDGLSISSSESAVLVNCVKFLISEKNRLMKWKEDFKEAFWLQGIKS